MTYVGWHDIQQSSIQQNDIQKNAFRRMTLVRATCSRMTLRRMSFSIIPISTIALSRITLNRIPFIRMTLSRMTFTRMPVNWMIFNKMQFGRIIAPERHQAYWNSPKRHCRMANSRILTVDKRETSNHRILFPNFFLFHRGPSSQIASALIGAFLYLFLLKLSNV